MRERQLYMDRVANWKELYDTEYARSNQEIANDEFNLAGWNSSFTGVVIPPSEMREWVDDIVKVILSDSPKNVLEIGCGTGLIYYPLADKVKKYIGTDLSKTSISQIKERITKGARNYCPTELKVCAAHEISLPAGEQVDTIILNSIVQYFPGEDYMMTVMAKCISLLKKSGRIIIGDVRDYRLLELFKYRLQLQKLQHSVKIRELKWTTEQEVLKEEELCFSPEFFYNLKQAYPEISHIDVEWKNASYNNELSLYRYTVTIHVGIEREVSKPQWLNWPEINDKRVLMNKLEAGQVVALKNVPNYRLAKERIIDKVISNDLVHTVGDVIEFVEGEDHESVEIFQLINSAYANGFSCRLFLNADPLKVNILLEKNPTNKFIDQDYDQKYAHKKANTNVPLFASIDSLLQKEIKTALKERLPDYMIPSELIALTQMPLTANGKIDRNFLNDREDKALSNKLNYQAPRNESEQTLVNVWKQLLNIEQIGIRDNFFDLGGHSLLAIRLLAAIRKKFNVELSVNDIFIYPTIGEFAQKFFNKDNGASISNERGVIKHLVPVKTEGHKIPIYIIAGWGTALRFMKFAELLDPDQPVYVFATTG